MKNIFFMVFITLLVIGCSNEKRLEELTTPVQPTQNGGENMKLTSKDFQNNSMIPAKFTCQGENINPHLQWEGAPQGVKSFALVVDDPDAQAGTWTHWLVKDIPANTNEIPQNSVPGKQVVNDFAKQDYGGPCPPSGTHRYFFKLYALDVDSLQAKNKEEFYQQVEEHKIEEAVLIGSYKKT